MGGKVGRTGAAKTKSTGGSLISDEKLKQLYVHMLQCRMLTEYAQGLAKRTSSARLYERSMGQEAIASGCVIDLRPEDTIVLAPRDAIASLVKGVPLRQLVEQLHARPGKSQPDKNLAVATQTALAHKKQKKGNVVLLFADQSTTMLGGWGKTIKTASKGNLPMIFVVENNARSGRSRSKTSNHQGYTLPVFTVDANDAVAVYRVAYESLERIRLDGGPVLVHAEPYRLAGKRDGPAAKEERDPLAHMERYLRAKKLFSVRWKNQLIRQFSRELGSYLRASRPSAND